MGTVTCVGVWVVMGVAFHIFECCLVAGDLDELDDDKHGDPDELEGGPEGENDCPGVAEDEAAELGG